MSDAVEASRAAGLRRLYAFIPDAGQRYSRSRDFDFGPRRRINVSVLSPYLRHRLVLEAELLQATLKRHSPAAASKFVQEIFWRAYCKGWLEQHPSVWSDYRGSVARHIGDLESSNSLLERYNLATSGATGIECFDSWAKELVSTGYLHNHARMWFASIWVYTLELPWTLGADFFLRNLMDGDPASNTIGWRWVCGLHTRGKTYLARPSNIAKYTDHRFDPEGQLATTAPPLVESGIFQQEPIPAAQAQPPEGHFGLLVTEEDCSPDDILGSAKPAAVLGVIGTRLRSPLPVGEHAYAFARNAVTDAVKRTTQAIGVNGELVEADDWCDLLVDWATKHQLGSIVTPYAPVGPVAERLAVARPVLEKYGISVHEIRRSYDNACWPHANRGYFRLKEAIPDILERLGLLPREAAPQSKAM